MPKGSLKSPALREAASPLLQAEASLRVKWNEEVRVWKLRQERDRKGNVKHKEDDPKPPEPKLVVNDTTIEALADAMAISHGLTLVRDELSGWAANMARYSAKGSDRPFFLECHSGGQYTVDRIMRGRQIVPDTYLNVVGGIQPKVARRLFVAAEGAEDDGFLERFGLICYPEELPWAGVRDAPPGSAARLHVAQAVTRLANYAWSHEFHDPGQRDSLMHFDDAAQARFFAWYDQHQREHVRAPGAADRPDIGFMAKAPGLVCRLAITLHLLRWTEGLAHDAKFIDLASLDAAIGVFDRFCRRMYARVCGAFGQVKAHEGAQRVADLIVRKRLTKVRVADITKMDWQGLREREPIIEALEALEDIDWLRRQQGTTGARGGRPADHWMVNPKVHKP
jgi:hypothetical protein